MKDYAEINACIREARRLRSEALGRILAGAWAGVRRAKIITYPAAWKRRRTATSSFSV